MNVLLTIKSLYAVNGIIASLLYLPQIIRAWRDHSHGGTLSPVTFGGWCIGSLITALYAWVVTKDGMFTAVSLGNMAGSGTIFLLVTLRRINRLLKFQGCSKMGRSSHPQEAPRRRSTPQGINHKGAFEDGGEMSVFQQPFKHAYRQGTKRTVARVSLSSSCKEAST
ncbi:PQ-loop repeat-containing protein [Geobacter sp. SVR]|uniref:PQ-loop repeat-containing protein n=1 Tax=Geobacter sp. SVR TaxID=2495594 RepID=UPI00143EFFC9|nr:PQ-loop repeat-containing protein [Geobacter sp. SVR]BCS52712.1 hypothetical protein GSVR_10200 [Geobacter sp. SVR]GCF86792.1 hypothetical protein GSbR_33920 [Geobacter sp. SVR]